MGEIIWMAVMGAATGGISYYVGGENMMWGAFGGLAGICFGFVVPVKAIVS